MNSNFDSSKIIKRRSFLAIILAFLFFLIISVRLFFLQIIRGDTYKKKSKENRISTKITPPSRGDIFDTNGLLVAGTISNYSFVVYKYLNKNYDLEIKQFSKIIKPVKYELLKDKLSKYNSYKPFFLLKNIPWNSIVEFEKNKFRFSSIKILETKKRYYPHENFSQIIGYMSESQTSLKDFPKGAFHIEEFYNDTLKGFPGKTFNEVNAYGKTVRQISLEPSIKGSDLHLTVSSNLQNFCQDIIKEKKKGLTQLDKENEKLEQLTELDKQFKI